MKPAWWTLVVSLGAIIVLAGLFVVQRLRRPEYQVQSDRADDPRLQPPVDHPVTPASADSWRALHSDDLKIFTANLRAAGLSDPLVRAIVRVEIDERYRVREATLAPRRPKVGYWQYDAYKEPLETRLARLDLKREKARLLLETVGADPEASDLSGLSPEKEEIARMIAQDYDALIGEFEQDYSTIPLPSERKMLRQIEAEKHREFEELLSREELTEYIVRNSRTGEYLRRQLRGFQPTEEEFRAIFEAQNEFEALMKRTRFDWTSTAGPEALSAAQKRMGNEIQTALGDDRYRNYTREKDSELQGLRDLADRVGASRQAAERIYGLREVVTRESKRIGGDYSQSMDARKAALAALAQQVRGEIQSSLGAEAAEAYLQRANEWLMSLEQGRVVELGLGSMSTSSLQPAP